MRIGLDARDALRREHGITVLTAFLLKGLAETGSGDEFIQYIDDYPSAASEAQGIVEAPGFSARVLPGRDIVWKQLRLPAALKQDRVAVFHSLTSTIPFRRPCRTVVTFCDLFHEVHPEFVPSKARRKMSWAFAHAARHADHVIAISENTKRDIVRFYGTPEEMISVIYPGVNPFYRRLEQTTESETVLAGYGVAKPFLLHVGGLTENRNITGILEALTLLKKDNVRPQLVLVGRPFWGFDLEALLQSRGLTDAVVHIAYASNEHLRILYNAAEVLLLPSFFEGFGIPVLEAMACGTPVVTSNTSALPEAAGDAGLLVDPREPAAIAKAVRQILNDATLKEDLIAKGIKRAEQFTWRSTAEQTLKVYHSLAES